MPSNHLVITIPTPAYLCRFISTRYGLPVNLVAGNQFSKNMLSLLSCPLETDFPLVVKELVLSRYNSKVKLRAPIDMKGKIIVDPSVDHIIAINQFWKKSFDHQLHLFCMKYVNKEARFAGYSMAIEAFARMNGIDIDQDISFDGLKKAEYRFRTKTKLTSISQIIKGNIGSSLS